MGRWTLIILAWFELISSVQVDTCSEKVSNYARSDHWQVGRMSSSTEGSAHKHIHGGGAHDRVLGGTMRQALAMSAWSSEKLEGWGE